MTQKSYMLNWYPQRPKLALSNDMKITFSAYFSKHPINGEAVIRVKTHDNLITVAIFYNGMMYHLTETQYGLIREVILNGETCLSLQE